MTATARSTPTECYPIRTVAALTGVNPITLRAWERRYGLLDPERRPSGHRLYRRRDIELIHEIVALLGKGMRIGDVHRQLETRRHGESRAQQESKREPWARFRAGMISAISRFDEQRLDEIYNEALALQPIDRVTQFLVMPMLAEIGERWESARGSVAEEHFFACFLRNKLGARFHHRARRRGGRRLLAACLPFEQHELGLLLFALAADEAGYQIVLLGADLPLAELPIAARQARCDAIVLSGSAAPADGVFERALTDVIKAAPVPVFIGGPIAVKARDLLARTGAQLLGIDIGPGLQRLIELLPPESPEPDSRPTKETSR